MTTLGENYELGEELGRGGMGIVYLGRDKLIGRAVAVKALPISGTAEPRRYRDALLKKR